MGLHERLRIRDRIEYATIIRAIMRNVTLIHGSDRTEKSGLPVQ